MQIDGPNAPAEIAAAWKPWPAAPPSARYPRRHGRRPPPSILGELTGGDLNVIRSGAIRRACEAEDPLVSEIVRHASEVLGYACLTVRHLLDPSVIVLGGGVIEACSDFIMPIVENIVGSDRLPGARDGGQVLLSALGDDAVVLARWRWPASWPVAAPSRRDSPSRRAIPRSCGPATAKSPSAARRISATCIFPSAAK